MTSRAIPTASHNSNKENTGSPSVSTSTGTVSKPTFAPPSFYSAASFLDPTAGASRTNNLNNKKSPISYSLLDGQKIRPYVLILPLAQSVELYLTSFFVQNRYGEGLDRNPFIDSQDILSKASEFGLKIWRLDSTSSRFHGARPMRH